MQQPSPDDQRNLIIAAVLSFAVIAIWQFFIVGPQLEEQRQYEVEQAEIARLAAEQAAEQAAEAGLPAPGGAAAPGAPAATNTGAAAVPGAVIGLEAALAQSKRVPIETPRLSGSISLTGGRIDQLELKDYRTTLDDGAPLVELLWPAETENAYYALYGWSPVGALKTPGPKTEWTVERGGSLSPNSPVTLKWDNGEGLIFRREMAIDGNYLVTVTQSVVNETEAPVSLAPYSIIARHGVPQLTGFFVLHEGAVGVLNGELTEVDYDEFEDFAPLSGGQLFEEKIDAAPGGWFGFTDKYWLTAIVPSGDQGFSARFKQLSRPNAAPVFTTEALMPTQTVAPGAAASVETQLFAGAKEYERIKDYQYAFDGVARPTSFFGGLSDFFFYDSRSKFTDAIDWGWFFFLTKPLFEILNWLQSLVGNMGVAIILLTVLVKTALFPLAYKSYVSMSKLKKLQPEMKKIQERAGDDKMKMQQEMMALYKKERVNPAAGCLPILAQIPIFFSLYKVLFVTLEVRHAPFFGWIQDLSAPDPTSILNLFGLLPWDTPGPQSFFFIFSIGVWPIIMGFTMWIQQMLNPAPTDPVQEKIFNLLPFMFMFLLGTFASGLVVYWTANNVLTILQQYLIMRSQGVDVNILQNMKRQLGLAPKEGAT